MDILKRLSESRFLTLILAMVSAGLLSVGFFLQYVVALVPCPLCILQRFFYLGNVFVGLVFFFRWSWAGGGRWPGILLAASSAAGVSIASRQVWLQHQPVIGDPTLCGVSFGSFLHSFILALGGKGNCAIVDWTLFSFSIAEWSLFWFIILTLASLWLAFRPREKELGRGDTSLP